MIKGMASRNTYECYVCKKNGFPETRVYLNGKTDDGKTIYKNVDMSPHVHKPQSMQRQQQSTQQAGGGGSTTVVLESTQLKILNAKLDRIVALLLERTSSNSSTSE